MEPVFFETPAGLRAWLHRHHQQELEIWLGIYKKATGFPTITMEEAVLEALCYGWVDGKKMRYDDQAYTLRFTPRAPRKPWSQSNLKRVKKLLDLGLMESAGIKSYEERGPDPVTLALTEPYLDRLKAISEAWAYFENLPPGARKSSIRWVMQPKRQATRDDHFETLLICCAKGERIPPLREMCS